MRTSTTILAAAAAAALAAAPASGQAGHDMAALTEVHSSGLTWVDPAIPGFDPGMMLAVVKGDLAAEGPYTIRLSFPAGYNFPSHWHPMPENVTVLSGSFQLAMGEKRDNSKLKTYGPGDYLFIEARHPHFGGALTPTVIQLHGQGPFAITLTEPTTP